MYEDNKIDQLFRQFVSFGSLLVQSHKALTHTSNKLKEETVAAFQFGKGYKSIYAILLRSIIHKWEKFKAISNLAGSGHPIIFTCSLQGQYKQCLDKKKNTTEKKQHP